MQTVKLINRPSFGHERLYPACDITKDFAKMLNRTCLRREEIAWLEACGHTVEIEQPPEKQKPEL